jgi:hypothetical protein
MVGLDQSVKGKSGKPDLRASGVVAYDATNVYVGADVTDDQLKAGADHVVLAIALGGTGRGLFRGARQAPAR